MIELTISSKEAGNRFDKYLHKVLSAAPSSFIYKMLRKKNITLNGKKADGSEKTCAGDSVKFFLSDETYSKMRGASQCNAPSFPKDKSYKKFVNVLYEDEDTILLNKPSGVLSQKAEDGSWSLNEYLISYLYDTGKISDDELLTVHPSVCNRLDMNTSGIVFAGKTIAGLQYCSALLKEHEAAKKYITIVKGTFDNTIDCENYLLKDTTNNITKVFEEDGQGRKYSRTIFRPIQSRQCASIVECELITGRSHQIRAQLAHLGFPCIGDPKYGDRKVNEIYRKKAGINHQLLHAFSVEYKGQNITAPLPDYFERVININN